MRGSDEAPPARILGHCLGERRMERGPHFFSEPMLATPNSLTTETAPSSIGLKQTCVPNSAAVVARPGTSSATHTEHA